MKNPPAFPCEAQGDRDNIPPEHDHIQVGIYTSKFPGMSLRDWFAGQALAGLLGATGYRERHNCALDCYNLADAMLAERAKGGGK